MKPTKGLLALQPYLAPQELERFGNRASGEPAARAAERLIAMRLIEQHACQLRRDADGHLFCQHCRAIIEGMKIPEVIAQEIADLVKPLAVDGAVAVYHLVRALVTHPDGAELQARRALQGLEAQAEIRT